MKKLNLKINTNNEKGITLVALIITIIILLILATVSISLVINSGILDKSKSAVDKYSEEEILEQWKLALTEYEMSQFTGNDANIQERLEKIYGEGNVTDITAKNGAIIATITKDGEIKTYRYTSSTGKIEEYIPPISEEGSFVGYYADVDNDGTVDGVIFADLAFSSSGTNEADSYTARSGLKQYTKASEKYDGIFGEKEIITYIEGTTGEDRFYVMSLSNIDSRGHYWYLNAYGNMSDYNTTTSRNFGTGKKNTENMLKKWNKGAVENGGYGEKDNNDMWGLISMQVETGWFVPSIGEWTVFKKCALDLGMTTSNYLSTYGFYDFYWSSSQKNINYAERIFFGPSYRWINESKGNCCNVRLATTF